MLTLSQAALVVFLLTGVTAYPGLREEQEKASAAWTEAYNQHDLEKISLLYTEDCSVMVVTRDAVYGREGVKKLLKSFIDAGMVKFTFTTDEVGPTDATDTAYERSSWTSFDKNNNIFSRGKCIIIRKKVEGAWLNQNVMVNLNSKIPPPVDDETLKTELEVLNEALSAAWKVQDLATMVSIYTEDARLMPPEYHTVIGKQAIRDAIETICSSGVEDVRFWPEKVGYIGLSKDMAYDRGQYRWQVKGGEVPDEGTYITLWKKVEGQWKIYVSMWTANPPSEKPHVEL